MHQLTSIATEASGELWSPDGKNILFTSDVYPECDGTPFEEAGCNALKVAEAAKSPVKAQVFTRLLYRHWNAYKDGKRSHIFITPAAVETEAIGGRAPSDGRSPSALELPRDLTPGDYDSPVFSLGGQDNYAFSPDGQEICYTSNHDKVEATSTNNDLWIVPVNGAPGVSPRRRGARRSKEHHRRQSCQRLDAALFARWQVHRLPRPAASGIRERPLPTDAVRPEDGREEEPD